MRRAYLWVCMAIGLAVSDEARAQVATDVVELSRPTWAARFAVETVTSTPLVGIAVALPTGSGADPADRPGAGRLAAESVGEAVERRIGRGHAEARVDLGPDRATLVFLVRPERASELLEVLGEVGFGEGPGAEAIRAAQARHADALRFQQDSPLHDVGVERRALLYGNGDPRTRRPEGTLASVEGMSEGDVEAARRALFVRGDARVVAVGRAQSAAPSMAGAADAADGPTAGPAWSAADRRAVNREVTNTWITVGFPVPEGLSRIALLFVADRMSQELNASPPDPGLFDASVSVVQTSAGEIVLVEAAVLPESADGFESRILALPQRLASQRDPAFFRFHRGRFRSTRLVAEAPPEEAAARRAIDLLVRGEIFDFEEAVWTLDAQIAAEAALSLGPPRVLVFGPDLGGSDR